MTDEIPLFSFVDFEKEAMQRREREREQRERTESQLEKLSLELCDRWDELQTEAVVRHGAETAEAEAFMPGAETESQQKIAKRVRAVVNTVPDAIVTFSNNGVIQTFNRGAEFTFGYRAADVSGTSFTQLMPESLQDDDHRSVVSFSTENSFNEFRLHEGVAVRDDGGQFPVEFSAGRVEVDGHIYGAAVIRDITERKRIALEMKRLNESLTSQVHETRKALEQLRQTQAQLVQAEKHASLGMLVAGVAHEVNTPVGIAVTAASHLHDSLKSLAASVSRNTLKKSDLVRLCEAGTEATGLILNNLQRAASLVQSFKQVAVDQSSEERREVFLREYIESVLTSLGPTLRRSGHRFELICAPEIRVLTYPGAISQILTNFVTNALIYAFEEDAEGLMRIVVSEHEDHLLLSFADNGKGIPAEIQPKIFDPFFTTRRGGGGSGLGLHIVFNLVTATLGGTIRVNSQLQKGTEFLITLPTGAGDLYQRVENNGTTGTAVVP